MSFLAVFAAYRFLVDLLFHRAGSQQPVHKHALRLPVAVGAEDRLHGGEGEGMEGNILRMQFCVTYMSEHWLRYFDLQVVSGVPAGVEDDHSISRLQSR